MGPRTSRGPDVGELAIDFALRDVDGNEHTLSQLLADKPVVLIFGSFT
jgi:peroxiredoxin